MLSVETIFYSPREEREKANVSHRRFASVYGDHLTFLNVSRRIGRFEEGISRREARGSQQWCYDNFINPRSMKTAMEIRKQLVGYCEKLGIGEAVGVSGRRDGRAAKASWTKYGGASLPACSFRSRRRSPRS